MYQFAENILASPLPTKAVVTVATDLNIAKRNWNAYPSNHPVVNAAISRLTASISHLLELRGGEVTQLGITRDGLLMGDEYIEPTNQVCKSIANSLFELGIAVLVFNQVPQPDEVATMLALLVRKREEVFEAGGIEKLWQAAAITSIEVRAIRYDLFAETIDDEQVDPEDGSMLSRLVRKLIKGDLANTITGPEQLAASLNARFRGRILDLESTSNHVCVWLDQVFDASGAAGTGVFSFDDFNAAVSEELSELTIFINSLDPPLVRQFLGWYSDSEEARFATVSAILRSLDEDKLLAIYGGADEFSAAPPLLQGILIKLLPNMAEIQESITMRKIACDKMSVLLQEHRHEVFIPTDYNTGLLETLQLAHQPTLNQEELNSLMGSLKLQAIDARSSEVILQLVINNPDGDAAKLLLKNLSDTCGQLLELGEYGQVLSLLRQAADPRLPQKLRIALRDTFCQREFLDEILSGLSIWGKPKYDQVALLIQVLGRIFIEPMLDRMAEEDNMSLRRFMMDRVQGFGEAARPNLLARLMDSRWYVLRNILVMLRNLGPLKDFNQIRPLLKHANPKVRAEALKLLVQSGDLIAQRQIMRDMDSPDREIQLLAVSIADQNSTPEMASKLLDIVTSGGFSAVESELKTAAVQALAEIGRPELLPELVKLLNSRSLLAFKALNRLKVDILRSFDRYPPQSVLAILEQYASGHDELARQASETLKIVRSRIRG